MYRYRFRFISSLLSFFLVAVFLFCSVFPSQMIKPTASAAGQAMRGDVNQDGAVLADDARTVLRASVSLETFFPGSLPFLLADHNGDGTITAADARTILRTSVDLEPAGVLDAEKWDVHCTFQTGAVPASTKDGMPNGTQSYITSELIELPPYREMTVDAVCLNTVAMVCEFEEDGTFLGRLSGGSQRPDSTAGERSAYTFHTGAFPRYLRISCLKNDPGRKITVAPFTKTVEYPHTDFVFGTGKGCFSSKGELLSGGNYYVYTNGIRLAKGEAIRFRSAGSANMSCLVEWHGSEGSGSGTPQIIGNEYMREIEYIAPRAMQVRLSAGIGKRVDASGNAHPYLSKEAFVASIERYFPERRDAPVKDNVLYGKSIAMIGDSLAMGGISGPEATWVHQLALKYRMQELNLGIGGCPVADTGVGTLDSAGAQRERAAFSRSVVGTQLTELTEGDFTPDYITLIGGANDFRLKVPVGEPNDTDPSTFCGALNTIIDVLCAAFPDAKLLFFTNYSRFHYKWTGYPHYEVDYVDAMLEICRLKNVPCFDNYRESGICFGDAALSAWMDEGEVYNGSPEKATKHLSREAYAWLLPKYESLLQNL